MRTFKGNLTRLENAIRLALPDGQDIYGYPGIDKTLILDTCKKIHDLADQIEPMDSKPNIEIITLKRYGSKTLSRLNKFTEDEANSKDANERFDDFIERLSKLYEKTKQVFYIVNKNGLRTDEELGQMDKELVKIRESISEHLKIFENLNIQSDNAKKLHEGALENIKSASAQALAFSEAGKNLTDQVELQAKSVESWHKTVKEVHENIKGWDTEVKENLMKIKSQNDAIKYNADSIFDHEKEYKILSENIKKLETTASTLEARTHDLLTEAQTTLAGANRAGMAASFQEMKQEMEAAQKRWETVFFIGLSLFALAAGTIMTVQYMCKPETNITNILIKVTAITPFVWLAWFAVRKHGIANRVREDYAFKYATARAYEGYKKAAQETGDALAKDLITISINNMAENPIRLYDESASEHASPITEGAERVCKAMGFGKKAALKVGPNGTEVSVEAKP